MQRLAALDVETTCLDPRRCRVVAAALVPVRGGRVVLGEALYAATAARSARDAALVHGIVPGEPHLEPNTTLEALLEEASRHTLITYGGHDARFLAAEAARHGMQLSYCYLDVMEALLANPARRHQAAARARYTLEDAVEEVLGLRPPERRLHDPLEDAVYTALLYLALRRRGATLRRRCVDAARGGNTLLSRLLGRLLPPRRPRGR